MNASPYDHPQLILQIVSAGGGCQTSGGDSNYLLSSVREM